MNIEKAPRIIINSQLTVGGNLDAQRDADDQHYRREFVKWLEEHSSWALVPFPPPCSRGRRGMRCISEADWQSLLAESGETDGN